jgi:acyl-CoA thioester hydrolase
VKVRYRDVDALGHVNHAVYLTFLEEACNHFWAELLTGVGRPFAPTALGYVTVRAEIDYRSPAYCGDVVVIHGRVTTIGKSSFTTLWRILDQATATLICESKTVQVVTFPGPEPKKMPADIETALREYLSRDDGPSREQL